MQPSQPTVIETWSATRVLLQIAKYKWTGIKHKVELKGLPRNELRGLNTPEVQQWQRTIQITPATPFLLLLRQRADTKVKMDEADAKTPTTRPATCPNHPQPV